MIYNNVVAREVAEYLLEIKAVVLRPEEPFTWASGLKSPIYCDNRKTLSHPRVRNFIKTSMADIISEEYRQTEVIAGVATAGIPHGVLAADVLNKPFVYVREKPKTHGMTNQIEGELGPGKRVLVIEDLISTGGSSLKAVSALREAGAEVIGLGAVFTYGFPAAEKAFAEAACPFFTLCDFATLLDVAAKLDYIKHNEVEPLMGWYKDPEAWSRHHP
ncbi:MAG: orotate phosphoribosyltransferase [Chitinophagales bacterium]|nr:orotate phosphoribosyltransferase [Chitinophagales bacterium]MDW8418203.1 orotate phosphoribosyltransferase [Chitinophagales bacterium]